MQDDFENRQKMNNQDVSMNKKDIEKKMQQTIDVLTMKFFSKNPGSIISNIEADAQNKFTEQLNVAVGKMQQKLETSIVDFREETDIRLKKLLQVQQNEFKKEKRQILSNHSEQDKKLITTQTRPNYLLHVTQNEVNNNKTINRAIDVSKTYEKKRIEFGSF